ncbi:proteasome maturation protein-like [Glandiceps talaboti]
MSFGYPTLRAEKRGETTISPNKGNYGVQDRLVTGPSKVKDELSSAHPLEYSELNFHKNEDQREMAMLRNILGLHAPLRLKMEQNAARQIQRLPCLPSSNIALDTLTGRDDIIEFEDILNAPGDSEVMGSTHIMMEKRLGVL